MSWNSERRKQGLRLHTFVANAVRGFLPGEVSIKLLCHGENTTFELRSSEGHFMCRVCRLGYQSDASATSELAWLAHLQGTGVQAPVSRATLAGEPFLIAEHGDYRRRVMLFKWRTGSPTTKRGPKRWRAFGALMAQLHLSTAEPVAHTEHRPIMDHKNLVCTELQPGPFGSLAQLPVEPTLQHQILEIAAELKKRLIAVQAPLYLIHADLHPGNVLFCAARPAIIDFDDCCFADRALDFAIALDSIKSDKHLSWFIEGYESFMPFDQSVLKRLALYQACRRLAIVSWLFSRKDIPGFLEEGHQQSKLIVKRVTEKLNQI